MERTEKIELYTDFWGLQVWIVHPDEITFEAKIIRIKRKP
jgi:hypothetical protein